MVFFFITTTYSISSGIMWGVSTTPELVLALVGLVVALVAIGISLRMASSAAFLGARNHEVRCDTRAREMVERVQVAERGLDRIADEVAADLSEAKTERRRGQAAHARDVKATRQNDDGTPQPNWSNEKLSAWATNKGLI